MPRLLHVGRDMPQRVFHKQDVGLRNAGLHREDHLEPVDRLRRIADERTPVDPGRHVVDVFGRDLPANICGPDGTGVAAKGAFFPVRVWRRQVRELAPTGHPRVGAEQCVQQGTAGIGGADNGDEALTRAVAGAGHRESPQNIPFFRPRTGQSRVSSTASITFYVGPAFAIGMPGPKSKFSVRL